LSFMNLALGLTVAIASLRVFGNERVVFWRESAPGSGMKLDNLAYFMAKNLVELPRLALLTLFFVLSFYPIVTPNVDWLLFVGYSFAAAFACSGVAYLASIALSPLKAQLLVVIYVLVAVMFSGLATKLSELDTNPLFACLSYFSFARWLSELIYLQDVYTLALAWRMPPPYYSKQSAYSAFYGILGLGYTPQTVVLVLDSLMLVLLGLLFRYLAYWSLIAFNRDKRGLPTLSQMSLYWIVNPLDDWARARRERHERMLRAQRRTAERNAVHNRIGSLTPASGNPFILSSVEPQESQVEYMRADSEDLRKNSFEVESV